MSQSFFLRHSRLIHLAFLFILILVTVLQALFVMERVFPAKEPFRWDSAHHSLWGLMVFNDMIEGNWISLLFDSYRQIYWPFMQSWFLAISMLIFGPTADAARMVSLGAYAFTAVALGILARRIGGGILPAVIAVLLWLTAGNVVLEFATEPLIESLAIALTALGLLMLGRALRIHSAAAYAVSGFLAMATYFTKTDYGVLLIQATLVVMFLEWFRYYDGGNRVMRAMLRKVVTSRLRAYLLPNVILAVLWFAYLPKIPATLAALTNRVQGPPRFSLEGILYHFRLLAHWSGSEGVMLLLLACFLLSFWSCRKDPLKRVLVVYIAFALLAHTISQTKDPKHIVKLLPWLYILAGDQLGRTWREFIRPGKSRVLMVAFSVVLVFWLGGRVPAFFDAIRPVESRDIHPIAQALVQRIRPGPVHLVLGEFSELSPHLTDWLILTRSPGAYRLPDRAKERFERDLQRFLGKHPRLKSLQRGRVGPVYRLVHATEADAKKQGVPSDTRRILDQLLEAGGDPDRILILSMENSSPWYTEDYESFNHPGKSFVPLVRNMPNIRLSETVRFPDDGIELLVFDRSPREET